MNWLEFDDGKYRRFGMNQLIGETLTHIDLSDDEILLTTASGKQILLTHVQDCCESVRIFGTSGDWKLIVNKRIIDASQMTTTEYNEYTCFSRTMTELVFSVDDHTVISKWIGESNGYYSENVDIYEILK